MTPSTQNERPGLAILSNSLPPYRINLHRLIADFVPEFKLHTLVSHCTSDVNWHVETPESIHVRYFGEGNDSVADSIFRAPRQEWRKCDRFVTYLRDNNVKAVICNGYQYLSYWRLIRHCHRVGLPIFVRNDSNIQADRNISPLKRFLKTRVYSTWIPLVSGIMSMSEYGDQFFVRYGADPQRLYRVPCVPDYDFYAQLDLARLNQFRRKFGLSAAKKYLLFSGRLIPLKRVDLIIDVFAQIAEERPDWDLLIVGDGPLANELRSRVPEHLRVRVVWTGFLDRNEPAMAYHAADVLLLPSERDAWGLVVQEAMAAGLVVVASHVVGAAHELIEDGYSGRIFPVGDGEAFKQAILQVTALEALDEFKLRSREALAQWRVQLDPIAEIRRALTNVGVL